MSLSNLIDIATDEKQTEDDWTKILDVCESGTSNPKECLKLIVKRMFNRNPHVVLRSIILLDACVQNIGESFAKEISSRYFVTEIKSKSKAMHQKALERLCFMMKKWSRELSGSEFDFINELNKWLQDTYPSFYAAGDDELNSRNSMKAARNNVVGQEEADIAKAIELSLKETELKKVTLYSSAIDTHVNDTTPQRKSTTKVKALYDFEAAEENELTFKAGEIIINVDTSNEHWWTGSNHRGEGMFPAQFVSLDLEVQTDNLIDKINQSNNKSTANDTQLIESYLDCQVAQDIDESKINNCIQLIEDADPTGELRPDPTELGNYEAQCRLMCPLIDQELEKVDRHYNRLADINKKIIDSFQMYNELMTQNGIIRPTTYMWPSQTPRVQYTHLFQDSQRFSQHISQQPQSMEQMQVQSLNYYESVDDKNQHEIGNYSIPSNIDESMVYGGYPSSSYMSHYNDPSQFLPTFSSNNNVMSDPNISVMTNQMYNKFAPGTFHS